MFYETGRLGFSPVVQVNKKLKYNCPSKRSEKIAVLNIAGITHELHLELFLWMTSITLHTNQFPILFLIGFTKIFLWNMGQWGIWYTMIPETMFFTNIILIVPKMCDKSNRFKSETDSEKSWYSTKKENNIVSMLN